MKVFGLYGKSGTGKSHKSSEIVSFYNIEAVIDDGILIMNKKRVAGKSAKNETSLIAATKRATFFSDSHRNEVLKYLRMNPLDSILVIGTSKKMINKIVERLELPLSIEWISIEKFQSPKELAIATERRSKNFHVIPIYPADITRTYFGSWFKKVIIRLGKKQEEVVVVKPVYTGKDLVIISPQCVKDIVLIMADRDINIHKIKIEYEIVKLVVSTKKHVSINELLRWRDDLIQNIHHLLNINYTIDIEWKSIQSQNRLFS